MHINYDTLKTIKNYSSFRNLVFVGDSFKGLNINDKIIDENKLYIEFFKENDKDKNNNIKYSIPNKIDLIPEKQENTIILVDSEVYLSILFLEGYRNDIFFPCDILRIENYVYYCQKLGCVTELIFNDLLQDLNKRVNK